MEEIAMTDIRNSANWSFETKQIHIGQEQRPLPIHSRRWPSQESIS